MRGPVNTISHEKLDIAEVYWHWCLQTLLRPIRERMSTVWVFFSDSKTALQSAYALGRSNKSISLPDVQCCFLLLPKVTVLESFTLHWIAQWPSLERNITTLHSCFSLASQRNVEMTIQMSTSNTLRQTGTWPWANTKHHSYDVVALCRFN